MLKSHLNLYVYTFVKGLAILQAAGQKTRAAGNTIAGLMGFFIVKVIFNHSFTVIVQETTGNNHIKLWPFMQECNKQYSHISLVFFGLLWICVRPCGAITQIKNDFVLFVISSFFPEKKVVAGFSDDVTQDWTNSRPYSKMSD